MCPPQDLGGRGEVAPGVTPSQQMMYATESQLRLAGYDEGVVANALELRRDFEAWVHQPQPARKLEARLSAAADEDWFGVLFLPPLLLDEEGRRLWIEEMDFDPRPVFARVRVPTLALWGGDDSWTPVAPSVEAWQQACGSVETIVLPNVEHDLTRPDGTFTEEFDHRLVEWRPTATRFLSQPPQLPAIQGEARGGRPHHHDQRERVRWVPGLACAR